MTNDWVAGRLRGRRPPAESQDAVTSIFLLHFLEHEKAKTELKSLMPEDAKEAIGHGVRAKRSKSGAISFDLLEVEASHAALQ